MSITPDWMSGVLLATQMQAVIVAVAIAALRSGRPAEHRLIALLLVLAGKTTPYLFGWRGHVEPPDWLALFPLNMPLAVGPLLYAYVTARTIGRRPRREWLHYAPALMELGYFCTCLMLPTEFRHGWKEGPHDHAVKPFLEAAFVVSLFAYTLLTRRLLVGWRMRVEQERSDADRQLSTLLPGVIGVLFATAVAYAGIFFWGNWIAEIDIGPFYLWLAVVAIAMSLEGWRGTALTTLPRRNETTPERSRELRDWSALGREWRDRTEQAGWWRDPELNLTSLARRLGINAGYLSRGFNEGLGVNFNELVNGLRAGEVARLIDAGEADDLLTLALDAGFSSKATFNRAFAARFGVSPSTYRRRLK